MEAKYLNIFQRCIRVWEEAHPYNAAQVLHVGGTADLARITNAWNQTLAASGLGMVRVTGRRYRFEPASRQEILQVDAAANESGSGALERFITREMNRPFEEPAKGARCSAPPVVPFRLFVAPGAESHHLGVIYQHWVADSISIRMLLRDLFCRLYDPAGASQQPLHVPRQGLWRFFGPGPSQWSLPRGAWATVRSLRQFRTARRLEQIDDDHRVVCSLHSVPDGLIDGLVVAARAQKATVNDLLLAALARACDAHGPAPRKSDRDLALGTISDLRSLSSENLENTFSLFLGFTQLVIKAQHLQDRHKLLAAIAAENSLHKQQRSAAVSMLRMAAGYLQGRFLSPRQRAAFYRNYMPLFGGVSNVNMNRSWPMKYHPAPLLDYFRVAPTGPMVPVVIAATTMGRRFTFVLTRRASVVDEAGGAHLAQMIVDELTALGNMG